MRRVLVGLLGVGLILAACGSGGESPQPTATETSQRAQRQETVTEQQQIQQEVDDAETVQQVQQIEQAEQAGQETAQAQQVQVEEDIDAESEVDSLPTEIVGTHKGVRSEGRVLGEPEAPVLIEHFGDFT